MPARTMKNSLGMRLGVALLVYGRVVGVSSKLGNEMLGDWFEPKLPSHWNLWTLYGLAN